MTMTIDTLLASAAVLILFGLCIFQLFLIAGKPLGHFAWGGQHQILPRSLRIGSAISILIYIACSLIILAHATMITPLFSPSVQTGIMWALTGYFTLGIGLNLISRSKPERYTMTPIVLILTGICFLLVK